MLALTAWGFFKGLYDANIFASVFDVVRPEARGTAAGFMNAVGWLAGGGSAPLVIGIIAQKQSLGLAIALASTVYIAAGVLLLIGMLFFVRRDAATDAGRSCIDERDVTRVPTPRAGYAVTTATARAARRSAAATLAATW